MPYLLKCSSIPSDHYHTSCTFICTRTHVFRVWPHQNHADNPVKFFTSSAKSWRKIPLHPRFNRAFGPHGSDWLAFLNRGLKWIQNRLGWSTEGQRGRLPSTLAGAEFKFNGQKFKREGMLGFDLWRPIFTRNLLEGQVDKWTMFHMHQRLGPLRGSVHKPLPWKRSYYSDMIHNGISYYTHIQTQIQIHTHTWINV